VRFSLVSSRHSSLITSHRQPSPGTSRCTLAPTFSLPPVRKDASAFSRLLLKISAKNSLCWKLPDRSEQRSNTCAEPSLLSVPNTHLCSHPQSISGSLLAVASETGYVSLFDAETGSLISSFPGPFYFRIAVAPLPVLTPSLDAAHSAPIRSLSFTSNLLVTGSSIKLTRLTITSHSNLISFSFGRQAHQRLGPTCAHITQQFH
jgi:WD40 repeat protein